MGGVIRLRLGRHLRPSILLCGIRPFPQFWPEFPLNVVWFARHFAALSSMPPSARDSFSRETHFTNGQNALYHFAMAAIAADPGFQRQEEVL